MADEDDRHGAVVRGIEIAPTSEAGAFHAALGAMTMPVSRDVRGVQTTPVTIVRVVGGVVQPCLQLGWVAVAAAPEKAQGRVPVHLDLEDVIWLTDNCICGQGGHRISVGSHTDACARIRWHADAALHRTGLKDASRQQEWLRTRERTAREQREAGRSGQARPPRDAP